MDAKLIANPHLNFVVAQGPTTPAPVSALPANDDAVARFQRSLEGGNVSDDLAGPQDLRGVGSADEASRRSGAHRNFGDAMLDGIDALSSQMQKAWNGVRGVDSVDPQQPLDPNAPLRNAGIPPIGELMAMQRNMVEFSLMYEAMGKGTSKTIDNTNQLVKMQ